MQSDQITGPLRAIAPLLTTMFIGWGLDSVTAGLAAGVVTSIAAAAWSWWSNRKVAKIAAVAAMPETKVEGNVIVIKDRVLATAARAAATPNTSGDIH